MKVNLKCFAKLSKDSACNFRESTPYEIEQGETVHDLANRAKISTKDVEIL